MVVNDQQGGALAMVLGISQGEVFALTGWRLWDDSLADAVRNFAGTFRNRGVVLSTLRGRPAGFPHAQNYEKPTNDQPTLGYIAACLAAV